VSTRYEVLILLIVSLIVFAAFVLAGRGPFLCGI